MPIAVQWFKAIAIWLILILAIINLFKEPPY